MDLRSFTEILAKRQGGVRLKPGRCVSKDLTGDEVERIFGSKPAAYVAHGLMIAIRRIGNDRYRVTVTREN